MNRYQQTKFRVNFLPQELRSSPVNLKNLVILAAIGLVGIPALGGGLKAIHWKIRAGLEETTSAKAQLETEIATRLRMREESADQRSMASIKKALAEKVYWAGAFKELTNVAPKTLWLTEFETKAAADGRTVTITGNSASQQEIASFLANLEKSFFFRDVQMKYSEILEGTEPVVYRFQFQGRIFDLPKEEGVNAKN